MNHDRFQQLRDQALDSLVKGSSTSAEYQDVLQKIDAAAVEAARLAREHLRAEPAVGPDGDVPTFIRPLESPQPAKGMLIGKYRLESDKGLRGGMSEVWKGVDTKNNRLVALKLLSPLLIGNEDEMARIQATFHLVEKLDHPHICRVFDLDEDERCGWYSVMRWVDGQTFSKYRREQAGPYGGLRLDDVVRLMQPVAEALDYAHGKKVLHRDIKPGNLMLDADGHVSVIDFGLAAEVRGSMSRVSQKAAEITGTRPYIAPEMWDGEPASRQTDQYALAVTAYELLASRWPFHNDDIGIFARIVLTKPVPAIDTLPAHANAALAKALAKTAKERFSSCTEFMSELRAPKAVIVAEASRLSPDKKPASGAASAPRFSVEGTGGLIRRGGPRSPIISSVVVRPGSKAGERMTFTLDGIEYAFRWCPPGNFTMGSPKNEAGHQDDEDQVNVELTSGFWMQESTVTQAMWQAIMQTQPWQGQSYVKEGVKYPATYVDWPGATEFSAKLTAAALMAGMLSSGAKIVLPTEARWEYGSRAGTTTAYSFGNDTNKLSESAWFTKNAWEIGEKYAHEVGHKQPNPWGLLDMHGNVWDWCEDYYFKKLPGGRNPCITVGSSRVLRGGAWSSVPIYVRCSVRDRSDPAYGNNNVGFRMVVEL